MSVLPRSATIIRLAAVFLLAAVAGLGTSPRQAFASEVNHNNGAAIGAGVIGTMIGIAIANQAARNRERARRRQPTRVVRCGPGQFFSKRRGRCFCRKGHVPAGRGRCVPRVRIVKCGPGQFFSKRHGQCFCRKGWVPVGSNKCAPKVRVVNCGPGQYFSKRRRSCLCRRGFVPAGEGLCVRPTAPQPPVEVVEQPPAEVVQPVRQTPVRKVAKRRNERCLPRDLYNMLKTTYGREPALKPCDAACLPKPSGYSPQQIASLGKRFAIQWCETCIKLGGYLSLASIRRIEQAAGVTLCMSDGARMCQAPGYASVEPGVTRTRVRTVIRKYPVTLGKQGDIAVVIGNEDYANGIIKNATAQSDADAVVTLLTEQLGYRKRNIIDLRNATRDDLLRVFGRGDGTAGELKQLIGNREDANVFIYASTHGTVDKATGNGYLLPVDARLDNLAGTAYALDDLYAAIGQLGARTTMVALEATFRANLTTPFIDPPNLPEQDFSVLPKTAIPGLAVFTASDRDQFTLDDPEFGTGLFTRYLIEGMAGKADEPATGNGDRKLDTVELYVYTAHMVRQAARKSFGMEQKPLLSKIDNLLVGRLAAN